MSQLALPLPPVDPPMDVERACGAIADAQEAMIWHFWYSLPSSLHADCPVLRAAARAWRWLVDQGHVTTAGDSVLVAGHRLANADATYDYPVPRRGCSPGYLAALAEHQATREKLA